MDAQTKVSRSITKLVISHPFFGSIALSVKVDSDQTIGTMCTDGVSILWSPDFVDSLSEAEVTGVFAHEVLHIVMKHSLRRGNRDPELWNIACDFAINEILLIDGGFSLPEGRLHDPQYEGMTAEAIYDRLPEDAKEQFSGGSAFGEVTDLKEMSEAECKQVEADIDSKVMMAAAAAKAVGKLPAAIDDMVQRMKQSQVDWRDVLRRFVGGDQPDDYTMRRPNKKMYHTARIIAPSVDRIGAGDIVLLVDSSGSVSDRELEYFLGEMNAISEDIKPSSITVITFDARVQTVSRYEQGEVIESIKVNGRGGTVITPAFQYVQDHAINVDNMVVFTDMGIFDYPPSPEYPVLWVSSYENARPAPFGETTYLKY